MAETAFPAELKHIQPFVKRAEEMRNVDKVVFYYCMRYFWAVKQGLEGELKTKAAEVYLERMVETLERIKMDPEYQSKIQDEKSGKVYMEKFSEEVFRNADEDIRMKRISSQTSKKFLASVNFFEVMKIWGELSPDVLYKIKYAKMCAIDIIKAYKNGLDPNNMLFNTENPVESTVSQKETTLNAFEKQIVPTENDLLLSKDLILNLGNEKQNLNDLILKNPETFKSSTKKTEENKQIVTDTSRISTCDIEVIEDRIERIEKAQKHARWAISALNFEDLKTAICELKNAAVMAFSCEIGLDHIIFYDKDFSRILIDLSFMEDSCFLFLPYPNLIRDNEKFLSDQTGTQFFQNKYLSTKDDYVYNIDQNASEKSELLTFQNQENILQKHGCTLETWNGEHFDRRIQYVPIMDCPSENFQTSLLGYGSQINFPNITNDQVLKQNLSLYPNIETYTMDTEVVSDEATIRNYSYLEPSVSKNNYETDNVISTDSDTVPEFQKMLFISNSSTKQNVCFNCGVSETPLWRRSPDKNNACGLYLKHYKYMRPLVSRHRKLANSQLRSSAKMICANCKVTQTSLWRKNELGKPVCNACGLYEKLHHTQRPVTMRKEYVIRRRRYKNLLEHFYDVDDPNLKFFKKILNPKVSREKHYISFCIIHYGIIKNYLY
ncbi:hypothetical protein PORY_001594 [Pneumocystis oryctolagi]|uniref:Uncharacterized protein n=1 Tax=Pneumocystis oryctolagi TaxID=42067 RepID=A0ACB7CDH7_9ASCO|nr:hypothetical protein PORY_001594 [Pneumocystis oryctolagi]